MSTKAKSETHITQVSIPACPQRMKSKHASQRCVYQNVHKEKTWNLHHKVVYTYMIKEAKREKYITNLFIPKCSQRLKAKHTSQSYVYRHVHKGWKQNTSQRYVYRHLYKGWKRNTHQKGMYTIMSTKAKRETYTTKVCIQTCSKRLKAKHKSQRYLYEHDHKG